jgi:hypothetical protein
VHRGDIDLNFRKAGHEIQTRPMEWRLYLASRLQYPNIGFLLLSFRHSDLVEISIPIPQRSRLMNSRGRAEG